MLPCGAFRTETGSSVASRRDRQTTRWLIRQFDPFEDSDGDACGALELAIGRLLFLQRGGGERRGSESESREL